MDKHITFDAFYSAYLRARKNKASRLEILAFEEYLEYNLITLMEEIRTNNYKLSNYSSFVIYEPKKRIIRKLPFRDRIVHQWYVEEFIKPVFLNRFINDTYACIENRGTHKAIKKLQYYMRIMYHKYKDYYILKMDISKFFDNIDKDILFRIMKKYFHDSKLIDFTYKMIYENNESSTMIPIGNYTSQYFANIYLHELDIFLKVRKSVKYYIRYLDDFVILVKTKEEARNLFNEISCFLNDKLNLKLNPKSCYFPSNKGVMFCGFKIYEDHILLSRKILKSMIKRYRKDKSLYKAFYAHFKDSSHFNINKRLKSLVVINKINDI